MSARRTEPAGDTRRLLVVTYHFDADGPIGGLRWIGMTRHLARLGWTCSVVTGGPSVEHHAASDVHVEPCPRRQTLLDGARWLRGRALGPPRQEPFPGSAGIGHDAGYAGALHRLGNEVVALLAFPDESRGWLLRAAWHTHSLIRRFRPHVVVSSGPPHSAHLVAHLATVGSSTTWLIDIRDPWAGPLPDVWDSHPRLGSGLFRALTPLLERLAFGAAAGVITNTRPLADTLAARYRDVRFLCVPNGVDPKRLPSADPHPYKGLGIAYAGTLYAGRDLRPVVRALSVFLERHPEAGHAGSKLRVAGETQPHHLRVFSEAVVEAGMQEYVDVLGPLPRPEALNLVSRSRLAVVLAQDQELQIPAKLYETVAMGIPTLVVAEAGAAAATEGERIGAFVCDPTDVDRMACILDQVWRNGTRRLPACPVPITYEAIAPLMDQVLRDALRA